MVCTIDMDMNATTAMSLCSVLSEFSYDVLEKLNVGIIERRCLIRLCIRQEARLYHRFLLV